MNYYNEEYLAHYGVKGMKWGVRRAQQLPTSDTRKRLDTAKADYKSARKAFNKSYNKAYNYSSRHMIGQFVNKKKSAEADRRWDDADKKSRELDSAVKEYKQAKKDRKTAIKNTYKDIQKNTSLREKITYNDATRMKAAKYMVDNNMSMKDATARANSDAKKNTAVILGAYGAVAAASLYKATR